MFLVNQVGWKIAKNYLHIETATSFLLIFAAYCVGYVLIDAILIVLFDLGVQLDFTWDVPLCIAILFPIAYFVNRLHPLFALQVYAIAFYNQELIGKERIGDILDCMDDSLAPIEEMLAGWYADENMAELIRAAREFAKD